MKRLGWLLSVLFFVPSFVSAQSVDEIINKKFGPISDAIAGAVFYSISISGVDLPLVIVLLLASATFFTVYFGFINFTGFKLAIDTVRGKYDEEPADKSNNTENVHSVDGDIVDTIKDESMEGEVSHFQALTAAVSGTVGLGNIAGVAIAISVGGPGATFWMIIAGLLGMASKFTECTLGVKYREVGPDGTVYGGPMYYLSKGLGLKNMAGLGKVLAVFFAICCIGGSFGGGNMAQSNQAFSQLESMARSKVMAIDQSLINEQIFINDNSQNAKGVYVVKSIGNDVVATNLKSGDEKTFSKETVINSAKHSPLSGKGYIFGLIVAGLVALVIIGGIKRIGSVTEKVVPFMCGIYILGALIVIFSNLSVVPTAFGQIISGAFSPEGITGGFIGVLILGMRRAAFSNEAGVGSAAIAHSAVKTNYPASEGVVALLEPFIDTVVICTMTALVIIITNIDGSMMTYGVENAEGVEATSRAFASVIPWFPYVLTLAVVLFAISTMLSWSYYGLQSWMYLFGKSKVADFSYKIIFCIFIVIGASSSLKAVFAFSDAMIFAMAIPNLVGLYFLLPVVKDELKKYKTKIAEIVANA